MGKTTGKNVVAHSFKALDFVYLHDKFLIIEDPISSEYADPKKS